MFESALANGILIFVRYYSQFITYSLNKIKEINKKIYKLLLNNINVADVLSQIKIVIFLELSVSKTHG
jgi:hypothetical protein